MRYNDWRDLDGIASVLPQRAGLFQIRIADGLLQYPGGRSAMYYYGYAINLQAGLPDFVREVLPRLDAPPNLLIRWMLTSDTKLKFRKQLYLFKRKFGAMPAGNSALFEEQNTGI